jgi:hypothetical protein
MIQAQILYSSQATPSLFQIEREYENSKKDELD